jgi:ComF family protein
MKLHFITPPYCDLCGNPGVLGLRDLCHSCRLQTPLFNRHRALWEYGTVSRRIIFGLKHGRQRYLANLLAPWIVPIILQHPVDCLIPVPLHQNRLAGRGFNQAAILATEIGRLTGIPVKLQGLTRPLKAPSQGRFSAQQRRENVMGAFESRRSWDGQSVLLIDDVFTTGSTLNACTYALREAGAHHIHAVTLAKVLHR